MIYRLVEEAQKLEFKQKLLSLKFEKDLPSLIKKNAASQVSKILTGDYDMKLARQKYHLSKLDEVSKFLKIYPLTSSSSTSAHYLK